MNDVPTARACVLALLTAAALLLPHGAAANTKSSTSSTWRPAACPPVPERAGGPSKVKVAGPCGFEHTGEADCEPDGDDLYVTVTRKTRNGSEVMLFVNVERFVGPGRYKAPNDIFVSLKEGDRIYRWWTNQTEVVVGPGARFVTFTEAQLEPERVLVGCTGPQNNYQCDGRGEDTSIMQTHTTVWGTIYCRTPAPNRAR